MDQLQLVGDDIEEELGDSAVFRGKEVFYSIRK
jgi:hypothetical protein